MDELDIEEVYYKALVQKFITAVFTSGMNWIVPTVPGQQEDATTPGASSCSMEARAAQLVAPFESAEAKPVVRMIPRERWTWKYQTTEDGPHGLTVLSRVKKQAKDQCLPTAVATLMESNLRVQRNKDIRLSLKHLIDLSKAARTKFPNEKNAVKPLILMVRDEGGVLSEEDYENSQTSTVGDVPRYRITKYVYYIFDNPEAMKHALFKLRNGGPLMAIINISKNYDKCYEFGLIYKYNPDLTDKDENGNPAPRTHAVCIVSFAIEDEPFFECQDSQGDRFGHKGFLKIDATSLVEAWSIVVA